MNRVAAILVPWLALGVAPFDISAQTGSNDCMLVIPGDLGMNQTIILAGDNSSANGDGDFDESVTSYFGAPAYWVAFTTATCADVTISFCPQGGTIWQDVIGILVPDGHCPADTIVGANEYGDDCGNRTFYFHDLPAGMWKFPVLNDPASNASGPFELIAAAYACGEENNLCQGLTVQPLVTGASLSFSQDNGTANSDLDFVATSPYFGDSANWHVFSTSECTRIKVSYCDQDPAWDDLLNLLALDCPASEVVEADSIDLSACGVDNGNVTFYIDSLPAGTYYLPVVRHSQGPSTGPYTVMVEALECLSTGLGRLDRRSAMIHPNPADDLLNILYEGASGAVRLELLDPMGRALLTEKVWLNQGTTHTMALPQRHSPGYYTLRMFAPLGPANFPVMIH